MEKLQRLSNYDTLFLQNRVVELNLELSMLKEKIKLLISNIEDYGYDYHNWEIVDLLKDLLKDD